MKHMEIINSKMDKAGNCYYAFCFTFNDGQRLAANTTSTEGNLILAAKQMDAQYTLKEIPIRKFERYIKGMEHAGCSPDEIVKYILERLPTPKPISRTGGHSDLVEYLAAIPPLPWRDVTDMRGQAGSKPEAFIVGNDNTTLMEVNAPEPVADFVVLAVNNFPRLASAAAWFEQEVATWVRDVVGDSISQTTQLSDSWNHLHDVIRAANGAINLREGDETVPPEIQFDIGAAAEPVDIAIKTAIIYLKTGHVQPAIEALTEAVKHPHIATRIENREQSQRAATGPSNAEMAGYASTAITAFQKRTHSFGEPPETVLADLLSDLAHYVDYYNARAEEDDKISFMEAWRDAEGHYLAETDNKGKAFELV